MSMLPSLLFLSQSSDVASLGSGNIARMTSESNYSIVFMYSKFCPHCTSFRPQYERFAKQNSDIPGLLIGQIDCVENEKTCQFYKVETFPQFLWIDSILKKTEFVPPNPSAEYLSDFVTKRMNFAVKVIHSDYQLMDMMQEENITAFCLYVNDRDTSNAELRLFKNIAIQKQSNSNKFFTIASTKTEMFAYKGSYDNKRNFSLAWNEENVMDFVEVNSMEKVVILTLETLKLFEKFNLPLLIYIIRSEDDLFISIEDLKRLSNRWQVTYSYYSATNRIVSATHMVESSLPSLVYYDSNVYRVYKGKIDSIRLKSWINNEHIPQNNWFGYSSVFTFVASFLAGIIFSLIHKFKKEEEEDLAILLDDTPVKDNYFCCTHPVDLESSESSG